MQNIKIAVELSLRKAEDIFPCVTGDVAIRVMEAVCFVRLFYMDFHSAVRAHLGMAPSSKVKNGYIIKNASLFLAVLSLYTARRTMSNTQKDAVSRVLIICNYSPTMRSLFILSPA